MPPPPFTAIPATPNEEADLVRALGELIGYGRVMQLAEQTWRHRLDREGMAGGEHTTGPCASLMVPCKCIRPSSRDGSCDWCCGAGRVTKHVRAVMDDHAAELRACLEIAMRRLVVETRNLSYGATEVEQRERIAKALGPEAMTRVVAGFEYVPPRPRHG